MYSLANRSLYDAKPPRSGCAEPKMITFILQEYQKPMQFFERNKLMISAWMRIAFALNLVALVLVLYILFSMLWLGNIAEDDLARGFYNLALLMTSIASVYLAVGLLVNLIVQRKIRIFRPLAQGLIFVVYLIVFFFPVGYYMARYLASEL